MVSRAPGSQQAQASCPDAVLSPFVTVCTPQSSRGVLSVAALGNRASREAASALCPCVVEPTSEACLCGNKGRLVSYSQWGRQADIYETDSKVSI